jgi:2-polyprenyl-3-methyl-5-hydroxy-6-metoxy-1,4-benzoquinol methylase
MMTESTSETEIRAEPCPTCAVCGGEGEFIYLKQQDRMYCAPGEWNLKRCANKQCRFIWLDPMPVEGDIGKAYACYYTHASSGLSVRLGALKREYLTQKYNYQFSSGSFTIPGIRQLLRFSPLRHTGADGDVRFLHAVPRGQLLDVGCGSGDWLLSMRALGWNVTGVDFDENAVKVGRQRGLTINCGALEQQNFPNDSFDAVTLNHAIEHVPDPVGTFRECVRILKPGGRLVVFTPNGSSLGHRIYKECWRGLEPPRHLHIFSFQSMHLALGLAGFQKISVLPWVATSIIYESYLLRKGWRGPFDSARRQWLAWFFSQFFSMAERLFIKWKPSVADCVTAIAVK